MKNQRHFICLFVMIFAFSLFFPGLVQGQSETTASPPALTPAEKKDPSQLSPPPENNIVLIEAEKSPPATLPESLRRIRDQIRIKWMKPEVFAPIDRPGITGVSIAGQTKPGTRVYLKSDTIFLLGDNGAKSSRKLLSEEVKYLPGVVDLRGLFFFELYLPDGHYELPVAVVDAKAPMLQAAKIFHLFLKIKSNQIEFDYLIEDMGDPFNPLSDYFTVGLGGNQVLYNKAVPSIPSELRFSSFEYPSFRVGWGKTISPSWRFAGYLITAPGATTNGTRVAVTNGNYIWPHISADTVYSHPQWKWLWRENYRMRWGLRMGLQGHWLPFIRSLTAGSNVQTVNPAFLQMVSLGAQFDLMTNDDFNYEVLFRFQYPVSESPLYTIDQQVAFDGSLGAIYRWPNKKWYMGLYWYGQWIKSTFNEYDLFVERQVSGSFDILYSNIECRWIYPL